MGSVQSSIGTKENTYSQLYCRLMNIVDWMPTFLNLAGVLHKFTVNRKLFVRGIQNFIIQLSGGCTVTHPLSTQFENS